MPEKWPQVALGEILTERNETPDPVLVRSGDIPLSAKSVFRTERSNTEPIPKQYKNDFDPPR
jgi:hypothetical protein